MLPVLVLSYKCYKCYKKINVSKLQLLNNLQLWATHYITGNFAHLKFKDMRVAVTFKMAAISLRRFTVKAGGMNVCKRSFFSTSNNLIKQHEGEKRTLGFAFKAALKLIHICVFKEMCNLEETSLKNHVVQNYM